jgi:ABC-2 type transport system ATP-binding protein
MLKKESVISLHRVSKKYLLYHEKPTLVENFLRLSKGIKKEQFTALDQVDLEIKRGERLGIIGANGSGKTTLLKIIAGITTPDTGKVEIKAKVISLIDLTAGFHPELTGEENIYLNAMLLGMSRAEVDRKLESIIDFAGLRQFIDTAMFTYSNGMVLRLGFAIAIHAQPEVLLLDEGLSIGDEKFRKKANRALVKLFKRKNFTVIIVSHIKEMIQGNCKRVLYLKAGKIYKDGGLEVARKYFK